MGGDYSRPRAKRLAIFAKALLLPLMLGWSMNLFRVRGIQLAVHFSFFLLVALFAEIGWADGGGWTGLGFSVGALLAFFVCVVLHELGHSFTAMRLGIGVRRILLLPIGGMAEFERIPRRPRDELLVTIAGPAVNFVIAAVLWTIFGLDDPWSILEGRVSIDVTGFAQLLLVWNLVMGCFNLLPMFPMDGGRIFRALLARHLPYVRATFIAASLAKILATLGIAWGLYRVCALQQYEAGMSVALLAFIFIVGELEYRAAKRQEAEEAHWRAVAARFQLASAAAGIDPA
jgi:Zn-dependent protease